MAYVRLLANPNRLLRCAYFVDHAVGAGRPNRRDDVLLIQFLLKSIAKRKDSVSGESYTPPGAQPLSIDGICGRQTVAYIKHFQGVISRVPNAGGLWQDGIVHPVPPGGTVGPRHGLTYTMIVI